MQYPQLRMYYGDFLFAELKPSKEKIFQKVNGKWTSLEFNLVTNKEIIKMLEHQPNFTKEMKSK